MQVPTYRKIITTKPLEKTMTNIDSLQKTYTQASQRIPTNKTVYVCTGSLLPSQ